MKKNQMKNNQIKKNQMKNSIFYIYNSIRNLHNFSGNWSSNRAFYR